MTVLGDLIVKLKNSLKKNEPYIRKVKDPAMLISSLEELENLIGNVKVKNSVAKQITKLLMDRFREDLELTTTRHGSVMLNTVLYGDPGVGKTLIAKKLAKIWYSMGFLEGSGRRKKVVNAKAAKSLLDNITTEEETNNNLIISIAVLFWITLFIFIAYAFSRNSIVLWIGVAFLVALAILIIYYLVWNNQQEQAFTSDANNLRGKIDDLVKSDRADVVEDDLVEEVSRADFVDKYVGWTDKKTIALLERNLGKVLFVDEAYSLVTGPDDRFGLDAVNTLNLFLSQHPGEIIVVFAGYKDLLETGIFSVQPGLKRRFMWHFDCEGYSIEECFEIFKFQVEKQGWKLARKQETLDIFKKNRDAFPNYGGDTERLVFFAQTEHDNDFIGESDNNANIAVLTPEQVEKGIAVLRENNISQDQGNNNILAESLRQLRQLR